MTEERQSHASELLTTGQVAHTLKPPCSVANVHRLVRVGQLRPAAVVGRGMLLFSRTDVLRLDEERRARRG